MNVRDRIKELRRVPARLLRPHPKNWRTHPAAQRDALRECCRDRYADALLARELADARSSCRRHLRAKPARAEVPVLWCDLDDREAAKLRGGSTRCFAGETDDQKLADLAEVRDAERGGCGHW